MKLSLHLCVRLDFPTTIHRSSSTRVIVRCKRKQQEIEFHYCDIWKRTDIAQRVVPTRNNTHF